MTNTPYTIDAEVLSAYNAGIERDRLSRGLGLIEFARTKEILLETLPAAPAVVYDIGGGTGDYTRWLAAQGYEAHLFDISPTNIEIAQEEAQAGAPALAAMEVADARAVARPDASADAVLLMGPLYHIVQREDRVLALREALRLLKPGGMLYAAGITRYASLLWACTTYGSANRLLDDPAYRAMLEREVLDGQHIRPVKYPGLIGRSFFHEPGELAAEIGEAGFVGADVRGVVGPGWLAPELDDMWADKTARESILFAVRLVDRAPALLGLSTHILAVAVKPVDK